jgi:hypothetical protein
LKGSGRGVEEDRVKRIGYKSSLESDMLGAAKGRGTRKILLRGLEREREGIVSKEGDSPGEGEWEAEGDFGE